MWEHRVYGMRLCVVGKLHYHIPHYYTATSVGHIRCVARKVCWARSTSFHVRRRDGDESLIAANTQSRARSYQRDDRKTTEHERRVCLIRKADFRDYYKLKTELMDEFWSIEKWPPCVVRIVSISLPRSFDSSRFSARKRNERQSIGSPNSTDIQSAIRSFTFDAWQKHKKFPNTLHCLGRRALGPRCYTSKHIATYCVCGFVFFYLSGDASSFVSVTSETIAFGCNCFCVSVSRSTVLTKCFGCEHIKPILTNALCVCSCERARWKNCREFASIG